MNDEPPTLDYGRPSANPQPTPHQFGYLALAIGIVLGTLVIFLMIYFHPVH
jgi:hypothetical protein